MDVVRLIDHQIDDSDDDQSGDVADDNHDHQHDNGDHHHQHDDNHDNHDQVKEASGVTLANEDVFMATQFGEFIRCLNNFFVASDFCLCGCISQE